MKQRYENLDGLRAYACIGIVLMHIRANGNFRISGFLFDKVIALFGNFTFLFMFYRHFPCAVAILSGFRITA